jgi:exonuclease SbcD
VKVFRNPAVEEVEIDKRSVGFIIVPYLHPEHIANLVKEKEGSDVSREQMFFIGQRLLKQWIANRCDELDSNLKILLGHYYVEGARLRETSSPEVLPDEFSFTKDMLPEQLDLAVFGHVHLHQVMDHKPKLVYTGAIERIDWGERDDPKGFVVISPKNDQLWEFSELPVREMVKLDFKIEAGDDPTSKILDAIPQDVEGKMFRLIIELEEGVRERISEAKITEKLKGAFYYDVKWKEGVKEKLGYVEFTMNPYQLLQTFIKTNYGEHPKYEQILKEGESILGEVLG